MLFCNNIPTVSENEFPIWRRIKVIDFPMKYCENPDPNDRFQKKINKELDDKIAIWAPYFAGYLVYWLSIVYRDGIIEPKAIQKTNRKIS